MLITHILVIVLYMEPDWDCLDLLNAASQRLDMVPAARRIFNVDGMHCVYTYVRTYILYHLLYLSLHCRAGWSVLPSVVCGN